MAACGLFVTGTDTGVGKTAVAVAILRGLARDRLPSGPRVGVYKPVASGVLPGLKGVGGAAWGDVATLWEAAGRPLSIEAVCPQRFQAAIAPPRSARAEGRRVDDAVLRSGFTAWRDASDIVIVEGAGGLFSPLGDMTLNVDLARDLGLPLVVVDTTRLGAIGRTLAVVRAARAEGLRVAAVVLSQVEPCEERPDDPESPWAIARDSASDLADRLRPVPVTLLAHDATAIEPALDWLALARAGG